MMVGDFTLPEVVMDVLGEGDWVDEAPDPFHQPVMQSTYHFVSLCRYDPPCLVRCLALLVFPVRLKPEGPSMGPSFTGVLA